MAGVVSQRYTPRNMVNSQEFRLWFSGQRQVSAPLEARGRLSVSLDESNQLTARFGFEAETHPPLSLHIVYLGNGLTTEVKDGENKGRTLHHDFVVLDHFHAEGDGQWEVTLPMPTEAGQTQTALVVWISPRNEPLILQAVGGYLPPPDD